MSLAYRVGRRQARNLYRIPTRLADGDEFLGVMFTDNLGKLTVHSLNLHLSAPAQAFLDAPQGRRFTWRHIHNIYDADRQIGTLFTEGDASTVAAALNFALWYDPSSFEDLEVPA